MEMEIGVEEVRWEEFMQKTVIRVLLVEPDFSTRQILTALLTKCNYKVAAVADGLKAWDILKTRHNSIDLILTELDLPSISGYALLTLITEHDSCKNIPVIVTSSQDCISKVLNCMLKGAADFLIKPVRKNELKNLWRHVWRKLAVGSENDPRNLATQQHKVKTTFENISVTDHYSDNVSASNKRSKYAEKATDVQVCISSSPLARKSNNDVNVTVSLKEDDDVSSPGPCREAMDLIGSMNSPMCILPQASSDEGFSGFNSMPELTLSLKRPHDSETYEDDEKCTLNHSNASAFSWYNSNKKSQVSCPLSIKDDGPIADCQIELASLPGVFTKAKSPIHAFQRELSQFTASSSLYSDSGTHSSTVNNSSSRAGLCYEFADQKISSACGSASDLTDVNTNKVVVKDEICHNTFEIDQSSQKASLHSAEREAALARFRLKRKQRCFDKKVRYQSRKKLAEQRPRVKGQFVRHDPTEQMVRSDDKL